MLFFTLLTLSVKQQRIRVDDMVYVNRQIKSMLEERTVFALSRASIIFSDLTLELTGREVLPSSIQVLHDRPADSAPVE